MHEEYLAPRSASSSVGLGIKFFSCISSRKYSASWATSCWCKKNQSNTQVDPTKIKCAKACVRSNQRRIGSDKTTFERAAITLSKHSFRLPSQPIGLSGHPLLTSRVYCTICSARCASRKHFESSRRCFSKGVTTMNS